MLSWITLGLMGRKKLSWVGEIKTSAHRLWYSLPLVCALIGSLEADLRQDLFQLSPFLRGKEGRSGGKKTKKRLRKSLPDSYRTIPNCPLGPNPVSPHEAGFYRSYKQPPEFQPNLVNSLSAAHAIGDFKAESRAFTSPTNTIVKMPWNRYHVLQNETDPYAWKPKTGFPGPIWDSSGLSRWSRQFRILELVTE